MDKSATQLLGQDDLRRLVAFRHELHRHPELSGEERETAKRVVGMLAATRPDKVMTGIGGHGVAAIYQSGEPGPTVLFRSELDALPIHELGAIGHRSTVPGKAHLCGMTGIRRSCSALPMSSPVTGRPAAVLS